jgi:hypothetical protein
VHASSPSFRTSFVANPGTQYRLYCDASVRRNDADPRPLHIRSAAFLGKNPGFGGSAWAIFEEGSDDPVCTGYGYAGSWTTSNFAAYTAVVCGLTVAAEAGVRHLTVSSASELPLKHLPPLSPPTLEDGAASQQASSLASATSWSSWPTACLPPEAL